MSGHWSEARRAARNDDDCQALVERIPYARFLGMRAARHDGDLRTHLPFRDSLVGNPRRRAWHGGVTAAFMENTALLQLLLQLDEDRMPKSIDFAIDYLLPGRPEDLYAGCTVSRLGSRVAQAMIRCWQSDAERPIAVARGHFLLSSE